MLRRQVRLATAGAGHLWPHDWRRRVPPFGRLALPQRAYAAKLALPLVEKPGA